MRADNWRRAHYLEALDGYGSDDAALLAAIRREGLVVDRVEAAKLFHIAHQEGTPQKEFDKATPRVDHWGRASGFNPEAFAANRKMIARPPQETTWGVANGTDLAFVVVHYRMPERRLLEFIEWNADAFRLYGARVVVVSDRARYDAELPAFVRVARFPQELTVFNLAATSNFGIRLVGSGIICKTDPDCVLPLDLVASIARLPRGSGLCPRYRMADDATAKAFSLAASWESSKGTLALHWDHWDAINGYDERQEGYGIEDGDAFHRAGHERGFSCERGETALFHVAHSAAPQSSGNTREDLWGRSSGFNPANHRANQKARREPWRSPAWGLAVEFS